MFRSRRMQFATHNDSLKLGSLTQPPLTCFWCKKKPSGAGEIENFVGTTALLCSTTIMDLIC